MNLCSDVHTGVGTPHITPHTTQNQGGTPHKKMCSDVHTRVGTPHKIKVGCWMAGWLAGWVAGWLAGWVAGWLAGLNPIL